ncbi:hypothetical protein SUGI_1036430 [Cryptomeria japonica]|nr:hypothetical protein SUGI_1036430 [Cryptomeria japonica]
MASKREADNSRFIDGIKRLRICLNSVLREEKEGDIFRGFSSTSKQPSTNWLTVGTGPWRQDGSGKGKIIAPEMKGDSGSSGLSINWLTLKIGSCTEDGSSKHIYGMLEARNAEKKGESSSSKEDGSDKRVSSCSEDGSNKKVEGREESFFVGHIPEDILNTIFCKLPLHTLFQVQIISTSWQSIISSSTYFHNLWEQSNVQMWLVMDIYDETSGCSNGLALYDVSRRLRYMKIFNDESICSNSQWFLRAGDGGLLVYSCRRNGILRVINPLTMQSHCLEDARLTRKSKISFYMKKYHDNVAVQLKFDPKGKTYQVILIIGNLYLLRRKKFTVLIYRSAQRRWEIRDAQLEQGVYGVYGHMTICYFPFILTQNQKIYWFSRNGVDVGTYDLNGDGNIKFRYILGRQDVQDVHQTLGIVRYRGRIIMVCKREPYTHALLFYELDELQRRWRPKYEAVVSPNGYVSHITCVGGDYIWVSAEIEGCVSHIICIDIDTGELQIWPEVYPCMFNVRNCLSMPLSFCPCS